MVFLSELLLNFFVVFLRLSTGPLHTAVRHKRSVSVETTFVVMETTTDSICFDKKNRVQLFGSMSYVLIYFVSTHPLNPIIWVSGPIPYSFPYLRSKALLRITRGTLYTGKPQKTSANIVGYVTEFGVLAVSEKSPRAKRFQRAVANPSTNC